VSRILPHFVVAVAMLAVPMLALAQANSTHFNVAAGLTLPTGAFGDRNDAGYNVIIGLGMKQPGSSLGFRAEGIYNEFNEHGTSDKSHASGITGNAIYDLAAGSRNNTSSLYIIGGIGYYSTREPFFSSESQTVTHGPVVVRFGDAPRLGPCPICRRPIVTRRSTPISIVAIW
jgi:hypothetical protein